MQFCICPDPTNGFHNSCCLFLLKDEKWEGRGTPEGERFARMRCGDGRGQTSPTGMSSRTESKGHGEAEHHHTLQRAALTTITENPSRKGSWENNKEKEGVKMWELQIRNRAKRESIDKHLVVNQLDNPNTDPSPILWCQVPGPLAGYLVKLWSPAEALETIPSQTEATVLSALHQKTPRLSRTTWPRCCPVCSVSTGCWPSSR